METDIEYNSGIKLSEINNQNRKVLDIMLKGSDFIERQYHKDGKPKKPTQWKVRPEKILEVKKILNLK